MYAVGIDISKGKSTVAIVSLDGEIIEKPFEIIHNNQGLKQLLDKIKMYPKEDIRFLMEATSHYHYPILFPLLDKGYWVCVENALVIKKYCETDLRRAKNDKKDSIKLANYLADKWHKLRKFEAQDKIRNELLFLSREYSKYTTSVVRAKVQLTDLVDKTFPGIKEIIDAEHRFKLFLNIYEKYWHPSLILEKEKSEFVEEITDMAKKLGHKVGMDIGLKLYETAPIIITSRPKNELTQLAITNCISLLRQTLVATENIIAKMDEIASQLKEFNIVKEMKGVGPKTCSRLIAEVGDVRSFKNSSSLIAYCGIDAPPYQSGTFTGTERHISKRGNKNLRKVGYEVMRNLKTSRPKVDNVVYNYIIKKELEGKPKKVAKIAGLNKFLRIYYARVMEVYKA